MVRGLLWDSPHYCRPGGSTLQTQVSTSKRSDLHLSIQCSQPEDLKRLLLFTATAVPQCKVVRTFGIGSQEYIAAFLTSIVVPEILYLDGNSKEYGPQNLLTRGRPPHTCHPRRARPCSLNPIARGRTGCLRQDRPWYSSRHPNGHLAHDSSKNYLQEVQALLCMRF